MPTSSVSMLEAGPPLLATHTSASQAVIVGVGAGEAAAAAGGEKAGHITGLVIVAVAAVVMTTLGWGGMAGTATLRCVCQA